MNETGENYKKHFIERLNELGLVEGVDFTLTNVVDQTTGKYPNFWLEKLNKLGEDTSYYYTVDSIVDIKSKGLEYALLVSHAIMGLVHHFKNRNWIDTHSYCYIMKGRHSFRFQNDETKSD